MRRAINEKTAAKKVPTEALRRRLIGSSDEKSKYQARALRFP
jgi:hypothetical protein